MCMRKDIFPWGISKQKCLKIADLVKPWLAPGLLCLQSDNLLLIRHNLYLHWGWWRSHNNGCHTLSSRIFDLKNLPQYRQKFLFQRDQWPKGNLCHGDHLKVETECLVMLRRVHQNHLVDYVNTQQLWTILWGLHVFLMEYLV